MEPEEKTSSTSSRRRSRPRSTTSSTRSTSTKAEEKPSTTAKTTRTRRGRRGGAGRSKAKPKTEATTEVEEAPAPVRRAAPAPEEPLPLDGSMEELMQRQLIALNSVQGSLAAIENRLIGIERMASGERQRLGIFVDVPNVMYAAERQKVKIDYAKLLDFLTRGRQLVRASAYAPISDDSGERFDTQRFVQPFVNLGYRLVTKPHKRYADGSMKANFDVELAIDVVAMSDRLDIVCLVSGDGDFRRLVELIASKGVRVEVIAFSQSTAQELRAVADQYIDLNDYVSQLKP